MKSIKLIALSAFLTVGAFSTVLYTSCSKDECKDVVCSNGGTCSGGTCTCPTGAGGTNCATIYKSTYTNTYKGTGYDNEGNTYTDFRMLFSTPSTSDLITMNLAIQNAAGSGVGVPILTIELTSTTATGSAFTVKSQTSAGYTYTGTGTISTTNATLALTETPASGGTATIYTFAFPKL